MKELDENTENLFGNLRKDQPFRVPEGYFETFGERLKARIEQEAHPVSKRSITAYLKPVLMIAASFLLVVFLVSVPFKKYFPSGNQFVAQQQPNKDSMETEGEVSADIISYFSEAQFLSALSDMHEFETDTIAPDKLADFIATNYSDYDIIAYN